MIPANFDEAKQSQLPAVELLVNMGFKYLSRNDIAHQRDMDESKFILKDIAFNKLKEINSYEYKEKIHKFSDKNIHDAIEELENIPLEGLLDTSKEVYHMIMSIAGKTIREFIDGKNQSFNFRYIDFDNPENNEFHVTVEFDAEGKSTIRPDIVLFVNGIPIAIIENKKSGTAVKEAITQMNRNQGPDHCPKLFVYPQLLIATNKTEFEYGTTGTPAKFYTHWREKDADTKELDEKIGELIEKPIDKELYLQICSDLNGSTLGHKQITSREISEQDRGIFYLLQPKRLLDISKNFILFDGGVKKVTRYQQYFAIQKSLKTIEKEEECPTGLRRKGGLIWHTQGSGKSLTMVMFVKALIEDPRIENPRIIIVTDRKDLDKQISDTFRACNLKKNVIRAKTSGELIKLIKEKNLNVITTLVHKFERGKGQFIDESKNIFVLIDEAHRTQGGIANLEMNRTIPNACYIGFTGTPLMKGQKPSYLKFRGYIDKYTIDDALADGVILELIYEGRYVELKQNKEQIDRQVERITMGYNQEQKRELQKMISKKIIKNNPQLIHEIAYNIQEHYIKNFQGSGLKAQIVAPSKYSAILFQRFLEENGKINTAVIISETTADEDEKDSHKKEVASFLKEIGNKYRDLASYEKQKVDSFKNNEEGVEILIVVDKLLTGFDAPRNTVLYLAKDLKDHNLLQAIARVNRIYDNKRNPKTAGFIIDYSENAQNIKSAIELFGNYDTEDIQSTLIDVITKIKDLEDSYDVLHERFKRVKNTKDDQAYIKELEDEPEREQFYKELNGFIRNFNECLALQDFANTFKQIDAYKMDLKKFLEIRKTVRLKYADDTDFTEQKEQLIRILDKYIDAQEAEVMTKQISINDAEAFSEAIENLGSDKSKAEAIAAQTQRTLTEQREKDPEFFYRFSDKITKLLEKLKEGKIADAEALHAMREIKEQVVNKEDEAIPEAIKDKEGADIFYRNLRVVIAQYSVDEDTIIKIIIDIFDILRKEAIVDWYKNSEIKRIIHNKIDDYLYDEVKTARGVDINNEGIQALVSEIMNLAVNNHELFLT